jgi:hypothetical protein
MVVIAVTMVVIAVTMVVIAVALLLILHSKALNPCCFFVRFN